MKLNSETMITERFFSKAIEAIEAQVKHDIIQAEALSIALNIETGGMPVYDNSRLITLAIDFLHLYFPRDENGFSEIEHYCFDLNFGKEVDGEVKTAADLYHELVSCEEFMVSTHPFIDDAKNVKNKIY